jgi:hypothetical protein
MDGYTLLGSKRFVKFLIFHLLHTTENTNAVVKVGRKMCVTCLGHNQHTHNNHNYSSTPPHNLNKHRYKK